MFIFEKKVLRIYHYQDLLHLDGNEIILLFATFILKIRGKNLSVSFFEKEEIHIIGEFCSLNWEKKDAKK